ncbi:hypothetical protein [Micromonospora vulcania]|uniref:Uncharacterized protein n=1 Tax=Micromonospora vulcania TaxID=1441873 RepID=A0ABW1H7M1_9ACTN
MPAPVTSDVRRQSPLLTVLFWAGVGLAPVAALILLVADGNTPLRFAAVLAITSVVLIGLSVALRPDGDGDSVRADELQDELEELRRELRGEIVAAAQRGNQAIDQAQRAQEAVAAVRRRLDATGAALAGAAPNPAGAAPAPEPAGAGRARVLAAEPVDEVPAARSRVPVPGNAQAGRGRVPGPQEPAARWGRSERVDDDEPAYPRVAAGNEPPAGDRLYGADRPAAYGSAARPREQDRPEPTHRPGVVRHTETVHVTTRHTVVDGGSAEPGGRYGGGYAGQWTPPAQEWTRGGGAEGRSRPTDHSWGEREDRPRPGYADDRRPGDDRARPVDDRARPGDDRARHADDRSWGGQPVARDEPAWTGAQGGPGRRADRHEPDLGGDEPGWRARHDEPEWTDPRDAYAQRPQRDDGRWSEQREPERAAAPEPGPALQADDTGEYWSQLRAGDRWAAVRDDDHGRELRVGERRAEVHADASGTEYRMADRWASVRHEEPRRHEDARRYDEPSRHDEPSRYDERDPYRRAEPDDRPALPVGGVPVPDEWRPPHQRGHQPEPAPERAGRRRVEERYGYPPQDDAPRAGGSPVTDRWR